MGKKPSVREVIQYTRGQEIDKEAREQAIDESHKEYLVAHSKTVSTAIRGLTADEKKEVEAIRVQWESKGPPRRKRRQ